MTKRELIKALEDLDCSDDTPVTRYDSDWSNYFVIESCTFDSETTTVDIK
jgi:hypothetical protein